MSAERTLEVAGRVAASLGTVGAEVALIGAGALAVHGYPRETRDLDLAVRLPQPEENLPRCVDALRTSGLDAELRLPDADDPLGGVIRVTGADFQPIEVVNFYNWKAPRPTDLGDRAVEEAVPQPLLGLRVVTLPYLVALKLYAGGRKSELDVLELLERNPEADMGAIRDVCARHRLSRRLEKVLAAACGPESEDEPEEGLT